MASLSFLSVDHVVHLGIIGTLSSKLPYFIYPPPPFLLHPFRVPPLLPLLLLVWLSGSTPGIDQHLILRLLCAEHLFQLCFLFLPTTPLPLRPTVGTADREIKVQSVENSERLIFSHFKPGVGQNTASHGLPTAKNSVFCQFVSSASSFHSTSVFFSFPVFFRRCGVYYRQSVLFGDLCFALI